MKVVGYGDNVVDRYVNQRVMFPGGNCVNFAVFAKKCGIPSAYLGTFGDDEEAELLQFALKDIGVDISMCDVQAGTVTERCDVNLVNGDRIFLEDDERENLHGILPIGEKEADYLKGFDLIHSGCYAETEDQLPKLKQLGCLVTFDFSDDDEYREDGYLERVCPYIDFALFSCEGMSWEEIKSLAKKAHSLGTTYVLATMGTQGQILFDGENWYEGHVETLQPVDTMGAGDSFFTCFLMSLLKSGWTKTAPPSKEAIDGAFRTAARFSAETCLVSGAFNYGKKIVGEADTILISKRIYTGLDPAADNRLCRDAEQYKDGLILKDGCILDGFLVIKGSRIIDIGSADEDEKLQRLKDKGAKVVDLGNRLISPGFVDNHVFFTGFMWKRLGADLSQAKNAGEIIACLREYAASLDGDAAILGHDLNPESLSEEEKYGDILDKEFGKRPVACFTPEREYCFMNKAAEEKYGFTADECWAEMCWKLFEEYLGKKDFVRSEYLEFQKLLASRGITSIKEIGFDDYYGFCDVLSELDEEKLLIHRVNLVSQPVARECDFEYAEKCIEQFQSNFIRFMGFNIMVDGEICAHGGDLLSPYKNRPEICCEEPVDYEGLEETVLKADKLGIRCALHAEGDRAVKKTVDIFEKARKVNGAGDSRHGIIDAEMMDPQDILRIKDLGVSTINYVQMMNCYSTWDEFYGPEYCGEERLPYIWMYRSQFDAGVNFCCGTDLPLDEPDIPLSIYFSTVRKFPDGNPKEGFNMPEKITVEEVLRGWTRNGQYANFREDCLGTLEPGKLADITVLDGDPFEAEPEELKKMDVYMTLCDGKVVYEKD